MFNIRYLQPIFSSPSTNPEQSNQKTKACAKIQCNVLDTSNPPFTLSYLSEINLLPLKLLRKLSRPLHLSRGDGPALARRAHGDGLESGRRAGSGADGELLAVGAADHGAGRGAGAAA